MKKQDEKRTRSCRCGNDKANGRDLCEECIEKIFGLDASIKKLQKLVDKKSDIRLANCNSNAIPFIDKVNKAARKYHAIEPLLREMRQLRKNYINNGACHGEDLIEYISITCKITELMEDD